MSAEKPASPTHGRNSINDNGQEKPKSNLLQSVKAKRDEKREEVMELGEFLERAKTDPGTYATPAQRLRKAIGTPEIIDTSSRRDGMNRIFMGETVAVYPAFKDFFGMEKTIDKIVSFIETAAKGGEQKRQILYFRGPVGTGKSSFTERLKQLIEKEPIYVLKCKKTGQLSPFQDSPLSVFRDHKEDLMAEYPNIPEHALTTRLSPWAVKRLQAAGNDMEEAFTVAKIYPSRENQVGIFKLEPGDKTTQDVSEVKGKFDISKIGQDDPLDSEKTLNETDPDAYMPGALGKANQGIFEFAEMFEAPKDIHLALLDATTMGECTGTKNIGLLPANCLIIAHSNDAQFQDYLKDPKSGTLMNRITKIDVPYTLRLSAEKNIYAKRLSEGEYAKEPIAPKTLDILSEFSIVSRLDDGRDNKLKAYDKHIVARVLDGQRPDGSSKSVPSIQELYENASPEQAFHGSSTRFAFKVLTETFNSQRHGNITEADPILLLKTLRDSVAAEKDFSAKQKEAFAPIITKLETEYKKFLQEEIVEAYSNTSEELCQNTFETYIKKANAYLDEATYKTSTGQSVNKEALDAQLKVMERAAGISDSDSFRRTITRLYKDRKIEAFESGDQSKTLRWDVYPDMGKVIRASLYKSLKDALPVIRENSQMTDDQSLKNRTAFEQNMQEKGYTRTMIARALDLFPDLT